MTISSDVLLVALAVVALVAMVAATRTPTFHRIEVAADNWLRDQLGDRGARILIIAMVTAFALIAALSVVADGSGALKGN